MPSVAPYYHDTDIVVVPVRAGGGTRIKLLEAFSYRRPVVATTMGAEGIEIRHGVELLLADTPADLAARCAELMKRPALCRRLVDNAAAFVATRHGPRTLLERLRRSLQPARASREAVTS